MNLNLHFTEQDWQRIARDWSAWWAGELNRPLVMIEGFDAPWNDGLTDIHNLGGLVINLPFDMSADQVLDYYQPRLEAKHFYGDAFPRWKLTFGPGIIAGFLGARVHPKPETVWFEPSAPVAIQDLQLQCSAENVWWQRIRDLTQRAVERWGDQVCIAHTDLGGNCDILASFVTTQQLLFELHDHPEHVARLVNQITQVWLHYYQALYNIIRASPCGTTPWAPIWSPGRCYMLQSDFAYMISPAMFERFILPDLQACCDTLNHAFYHLDGKGQIRHLDQLLAIKNLHGIQWIPGDGAPPPHEWLPLLKRIRDAGKLCQLFVSPQGAQTIVRELGGRGFAFYITQQMSADEANDFLRALQAQDRTPWQ